jgi:hypothetical protein
MPQRALGARRKTKLRRELPEATGDPRELIRDRVRPAQVVDRLGACGGGSAVEASAKGGVQVR